MKLEFRPRAVADLAEIRDYLLAHTDSAAADRVRRHVRHNARDLPELDEL